MQAATDGTIDAYCKALEGLDPEAVVEAVTEFCTGVLNRNHSYRPTAPELATRARLWHELKHPKPKAKALPPPEENPISPEERERVKRGFEKLLRRRLTHEAVEQAKRDKRMADRLSKANEAALARDERPLAERLGRLAEPRTQSA